MSLADMLFFVTLPVSVEGDGKMTQPFELYVEFLHAMDLEPGELKPTMAFKAKNSRIYFKQRIFSAHLMDTVKAGRTKVRLVTDCLDPSEFPLELAPGRAKLQLQFTYKSQRLLKLTIPMSMKYNQEMGLEPPAHPSFAQLVVLRRGEDTKKYYEIDWVIEKRIGDSIFALDLFK